MFFPTKKKCLAIDFSCFLCFCRFVLQPQEPFVFGQEAQAAMRSAMNLRYSLLPFLYTLFHHAHSSATTVARPLFMEYVSFLPTLISSRFLFLPLTSAHSFCAPLYRFPTDLNCKSIDQQFLWGGSLLISPVLKQGAVKVAAYLPLGTWYSLHNVSANTVFY